MTEDNHYFNDVHEPENEPAISMDEIRNRVKQLATVARETHEHSYKAYLWKFSQLIESYVANTNEQTERGIIFLCACEYDYHMPREIEKLPDDLAPTLACTEDCLHIDHLDDNEDQEPGPSPG